MRYFSLFFVAFIGIAISSGGWAADIVIVNRDGAGEGLNSSRVVAPVPGNSATSLGQQYRNVFEAAAKYWEAKLISAVPITVDVQLDALRCQPTFGTLGAAGPRNGAANFVNAPVRDTTYVIAHANSLAGVDLDPNNSDINAVFNSNIGTAGCLTGLSWWLGIDSPAPSGTVSFYDTVLHEIGHGIGFLSLVSSDGVRFQGRNDPYMLNLFDVNQNLPWSRMSNGQRARSSINNQGLVWSGSNVAEGAGVFTGGRSNGMLRMYSPNPFQIGSSVSHWDTVVSPDELMEPLATDTSDSCATILALKDMGWRTRNECVDGVVVPIAPILLLLDDDE